jgi:hypothetical protein
MKRTNVGSVGSRAKKQVTLAAMFNAAPGEGDKSKAADTSTAAASAGTKPLNSQRSWDPAGWVHLGNGSTTAYWPRVLSKVEHDRFFQKIEAETRWRTGSIMIFGKLVLQPRHFCWMADDPNQRYSYSGSEMVVEPWHDAVLPLKVRPLA